MGPYTQVDGQRPQTLPRWSVWEILPLGHLSRRSGRYRPPPRPAGRTAVCCPRTGVRCLSAWSTHRSSFRPPHDEAGAGRRHGIRLELAYRTCTRPTHILHEQHVFLLTSPSNWFVFLRSWKSLCFRRRIQPTYVIRFPTHHFSGVPCSCRYLLRYQCLP